MRIHITPVSMGSVEAKGLLIAPERPDAIPEHAQWLGGVGAGSWFALHHDATMGRYQYRIQRFSPDGGLECDGTYFLDDDYIDLGQPYQFTYLSHCEVCTVLQGDQKFILELVNYPIAEV